MGAITTGVWVAMGIVWAGQALAQTTTGQPPALMALNLRDAHNYGVVASSATRCAIPATAVTALRSAAIALGQTPEERNRLANAFERGLWSHLHAPSASTGECGITRDLFWRITGKRLPAPDPKLR